MIRVGPSHIRGPLPFSGANAVTDHQLIPYINIFYYIC